LLRLGDEAKLSDEVREEKKQILEKFTIEEKDHIIRYVNRARIFIQNIVQRRKTIKHITEKLIESQQGYIETGSKRFLRPLTRTELAAKAGVHESTVSRALLRKYVQLPNQDVLTYDSFFSTAGPIKEQIAEIVLKEPQGKPYSDEKIRELLQEQGVTVARRTVLKYREELRIPSSHLRKRK
jgi:RNA polymerase sigma-54 factor